MWISSLGTHFVVEAASEKTLHQFGFSTLGYVWVRTVSSDPNIKLKTGRPWFRCGFHDPDMGFKTNDPELLGCRFGNVTTAGELFVITTRIILIRFWCITVPLTVMSAFLLLSTPRKSSQMKIAEPIVSDGA